MIDAVTGAKTVFTYKYAPTTPQTYTVVLHLEGGSYTTTPGTYTANSDGTYQYSVTQTSAVIKPESPSRNNFGFEGWSLSKNAPQTLIAKDATFAILYLEQSGTSGSFDKIDLYAVWEESEPSVTVNKKVETVGDEPFERDKTVARQNDKIVWSVTVTNEKDAPAQVTLTDVMAAGVYTDVGCQTEASAVNWDAAAHSWTATVSPKGSSIYYVCYTVTQDDIPKGKIVNTIVKGDDKDHPINSDPVSTWDTKQLKSATSLDDWTTTVTLTLPTVKQPDQTIAISEGSKVEDTIGNKFTLIPDSFKLTVGGTELQSIKEGETYYFGDETVSTTVYKFKVTVTKTESETKFNWDINEAIKKDTVTLSYKLELTTREKNPGTYGKDDLDGSLGIPESEAVYTNKSAILCDKENTKLAEFPKPSVSYTIKSSSGSHSGGSRPSLNTKDHYGYIIGYPVDYYTGQPTTDQTKKPVRPEGKITRAEVATIYFRMLTDESRTKFWSQSNSYSDVKAGDWFNNAVSTLSNAGIIAGYEDGSFKPNGYITRAEFATIAARFFDVTYNGKDLFPDISGHWAKDYINQAANKGFVNGYEDGTFKPDRNITRAEAVTLVNRTLDRHPDKSHFTKDMLVWPDNMDQTKWYYADMQEATNSHTYQMKENSDKTKYENWTKTLPIRNWEALEKAWSNANSSQGNGNVV